MSDSYTRWYRTGTASFTLGSKAVSGNNTYWLNASINPGDLLTIDGAQFYEIDEIIDNSHISLKTAFAATSINNSPYSIVRNFTASMPAKVAAQTADLLGDFRQYIDNDMQTITGKSAYEVAVANGFTGTQAQWLESLKAAGEWATLDSRTTLLTELPYDSHNYLLRGKFLGNAVSAAQYQAIARRTFDDLYVGDYWIINGTYYHILHCNYLLSGDNTPNLLLWHYDSVKDANGQSPWYTTDNTTGDPRYDLSAYYLNIRPTLEEKLARDFGASHLLTWYAEFVLFDLSTKIATSWASAPAIAHLPSWEQVYGGYAPLYTPDMTAHTFPSGGLCNPVSPIAYFKIAAPAGTLRNSIGYLDYWKASIFYGGAYGTNYRLDLRSTAHQYRPIFAIKA